MVREAKSKLYEVGSRHTLYLQKELVSDSAFPFKPNEELNVKIEDGRLVVERITGRKGKKSN